MGGGLMQLVAYGAQDIYLTGNPQITFFKVVYRRHTNFAMEAIEQTFNGAAKLGQKFSCTIARNGDLLGQVYLEMDVSVSAAYKSVDEIEYAGGAAITTGFTFTNINGDAANRITLKVGAAGAENIQSTSGTAVNNLAGMSNGGTAVSPSTNFTNFSG